MTVSGQHPCLRTIIGGYRDASADLINLLDCHELAGILDRFRGGREIISVAHPQKASRRSSRCFLDLLAKRSDAISR